jgi:triosephosphate isomerase
LLTFYFPYDNIIKARFIMNRKPSLKAPFFEIGPKSYLYGDDVFALALAADEAAARYQVDVLFTAPLVDIRRIAGAVKRLLVFAPHMDPIRPGRGVADVLPESLAAAGASGVMINHCEKPVSLNTLEQTIRRAGEVGLLSIVCTDTVAQAEAAARLRPDIIVAEPTELIGTGKTSDPAYVEATIGAIKSIDPGILILQSAGISSGEDVYRVIAAGAEGTGSSSGIAKATDRAAMVDEMLCALRRAWDDRHKE